MGLNIGNSLESTLKSCVSHREISYIVTKSSLIITATTGVENFLAVML